MNQIKIINKRDLELELLAYEDKDEYKELLKFEEEIETIIYDIYSTTIIWDINNITRQLKYNDIHNLLDYTDYIAKNPQLNLPKDESALPITNDEYYKYVFSKLGFYPEKLLEQNENVRMFCNSLADSCLLYLLYEKILKEEKFNNIIHNINFRSLMGRPQIPSLLISDKYF